MLARAVEPVGKSPQGVIRNKNGRIGSADWRRRSQALSPRTHTHICKRLQVRDRCAGKLSLRNWRRNLACMCYCILSIGRGTLHASFPLPGRCYVMACMYTDYGSLALQILSGQLLRLSSTHYDQVGSHLLSMAVSCFVLTVSLCC